MLRIVVPPSRRILTRYGPASARLRSSNQVRYLADKPSINDPTPPVLPGSQSKTASVPAPPPPGPVPPVHVPPAAIVKPRAPGDTPISAQSPPLVPPEPPLSTTKGPSSPPPPPPPPKKKPRRLRNYLFYLVLLTGLGFGGGVWYSMVSDNFHDFFTEYVPFGEDAVLYFEEREFKKRFPQALNRAPRAHESAPRVNIPGKSGISSKVTASGREDDDASKKARQSSALSEHPNASSAKAENKTQAQTPKVVASEKLPEKAVSAQPSRTKIEKDASSVPSTTGSSPASAGAGAAKRMPEVDEPSVYIPITRIDPINIQNANEPLVQDLVKILNDIILVVNSDNRSSQMASTINKAKGELAKVGQRIMDLKNAEQTDAQAKIKSSEAQFDKAARELVRRLEDDLRDQESKWREEFDSERKKLHDSYEDRLSSEAKKLAEIADQQTRNELAGQAVALKKSFASVVKDQVESERNGRLARLSELSSSVDELERLASAWNAVIDSNLQTQHLQVTVEAVRAHIERSEGLRPFIKELAALKEIAVDDAVIGSAIASINPVAYQRGIPSPAQLIDRFRSVADEVRKASLLPNDAGVTSHAASFLASKVLFKKQGKAVGDDVESVLTRTETFLEEGSFDEAAREMNSLTGWAKTLSGDWLAELRRVLEVRQALDIISTEARLQSLKVD